MLQQITLIAGLVIILALTLVLWSIKNYGTYKTFTYTKKTGKEATLGLVPYKLPRSRKHNIRIATSFKSLVIHLRELGYEKIIFESHLVNIRSEKIIKKILNDEGGDILSVSYRKTPLIHKISIHMNTIVFKLKIPEIDNMSGKVIASLRMDGVSPEPRHHILKECV